MNPTQMLRRAIRAARLDATVYDEIDADSRAWTEGLLVYLAGILVMILARLVRNTDALLPLLTATAGTIGAWLLSVLIVKLLASHPSIGGRTGITYASLLGAMSYGTAPAVFLVAGTLPRIGSALAGVLFAWQFASITVSVRARLGFHEAFKPGWLYGLSLAAVTLLLQLLHLGAARPRGWWPPH